MNGLVTVYIYIKTTTFSTTRGQQLVTEMNNVLININVVNLAMG